MIRCWLATWLSSRPRYAGLPLTLAAALVTTLGNVSAAASVTDTETPVLLSFSRESQASAFRSGDQVTR